MTPPPPTFQTIVQLHQLQAMLVLGYVPHPATRRPLKPDLRKGRHELQLLRILRERTAGNLSAEEQQFLDMAIATVEKAVQERLESP